MSSNKAPSTRKIGDGIESPELNDVLSGRGNFANYHPGNEFFRKLVKEHRTEYVKAPKSKKGYYSVQIVDKILSLEPPGRFLKQDPKTKLWHELPYKKALDKTRQALREGAPEIMKELKGDEGADGQSPRQPNPSYVPLENLTAALSKIEDNLGGPDPDVINKLISAASAANVNEDSPLSVNDMESILRALQSNTSGVPKAEDGAGPMAQPRAGARFHSSMGTIGSNKMMAESFNWSQNIMHESFQTMRTITSDIFSDSEYETSDEEDQDGKLMPAPLPRPSRESTNLDSVAQQKMNEINSSAQKLSISGGSAGYSLNDLLHTFAQQLSKQDSSLTLPAGNTSGPTDVPSNPHAAASDGRGAADNGLRGMGNMSINLANYSMKDDVILNAEPNTMQMSEMSMSIASIGSFEVPERVETSVKPTKVFDSSMGMNMSQMSALDEFE